jgi:hypothetical protein
MKRKTWVILLTLAAVLLLAYSMTVTSGYFDVGKSSTNNVLRVKIAPLFGAADSFAVLAGSTVTNDGNTVVTGDLGLSPGTSVIGFPPGIVIGTSHVTDAAAAQAKLDLTTAYNDAAGRAAVTIGTELGGTSPGPGIYTAGTFGLTGILALTGDANAIWIFHTTSTLDTAAGSQVVLSGGAKATNVYWVVESSATLGANSFFKGNIMAYASITMYAGANLEGRALAQTAAVTLNANAITRPAP